MELLYLSKENLAAARALAGSWGRRLQAGWGRIAGEAASQGRWLLARCARIGVATLACAMRARSRGRNPIAAVAVRMEPGTLAASAALCSAVLSLPMAAAFGRLLGIPDTGSLIGLALTLSISVVPLLAGLVGFAMRDLRRERRQARQLAVAAERERRHLFAAVNNMPIGLVMFDAAKQLILCNDCYRDMYELPSEVTVRGTHLRQMLERRVDRGNFEGSERQDYIERILKLVEVKETSVRVSKLGSGRSVRIIHHPIASGGWVGTHDDVTEREELTARLEAQNELLKAKEEQLQTQNMHLDAALNNMVQGLAMYDADYRLVLCNERFADIYGLAPEHLKIGTPLREIVEHRVGDGLYSEKSPQEIVDALVRRRQDGDFEQFQNELSDGRCIAVTVQPMPDGGTVTTHQDITEQRRSEARIAHMALHDALTGLPNRMLLNERLGQALARVKRGELVAAHLIDLDHFKNVNDTLGHPAGDKLLKMATERLRGVARGGDTVARMGGDEFAIVQTAIEHPSDATALALRLIEIVSEPYDVDGQQVVIGTSVGIAVGPADGLSPDELMRNADLALYRAKGDGRGTFRFFEQAMDAQMQERRAMERDLRKALAAGEFELHYQPVVNLARDEIRGFEALIRWRHPEKGLIPPSAFIPLAEEIGFIIPLGEWALRKACATAAKWPGQLEVAVNLSPAQFGTPGLLEVVVGALAASGLPADRLELEITEGTLLQDSENTLSTLFQLRALGVRIALDDFGTGYSSLSYLQSFPFDKIKIDRSFIQDVAEGVGSLNIVRAVAAMAKGLGMSTTAEGVETLEQLETVRAEGCTEMQGFLFSRPLPIEQIEALYLTAASPRLPSASVAA
jgi:diguanylate cyclase (GGDEF)-like protein